jgi:hypothetical protein
MASGMTNKSFKSIRFPQLASGVSSAISALMSKTDTFCDKL